MGGPDRGRSPDWGIPGTGQPLISEGIRSAIASSGCSVLVGEERDPRRAIETICVAQPDVIVLSTDPGMQSTMRLILDLRKASFSGKLIVVAERGPRTASRPARPRSRLPPVE